MSLNIITTDAASFTLTQDEVKRIPLLANMYEDCSEDMTEDITVNVHSSTMKLVLLWLNKQEGEAYWPNYDKDTIFAILMAADYLSMIEFLQEGAKYVADNHVKGRTVEELRVFFNKTDDFTDEQREEIARENQWMENL
jgi:hypothetical protein